MRTGLKNQHSLLSGLRFRIPGLPSEGKREKKKKKRSVDIPQCTAYQRTYTLAVLRVEVTKIPSQWLRKMGDPCSPLVTLISKYPELERGR
jgi:hypothetical protein